VVGGIASPIDKKKVKFGDPEIDIKIRFSEKGGRKGRKTEGIWTWGQKKEELHRANGEGGGENCYLYLRRLGRKGHIYKVARKEAEISSTTAEKKSQRNEVRKISRG